MNVAYMYSFSVNGDLICFHFRAIINKVTMTLVIIWFR